jgi:hypothetical protein
VWRGIGKQSTDAVPWESDSYLGRVYNAPIPAFHGAWSAIFELNGPDCGVGANGHAGSHKALAEMAMKKIFECDDREYQFKRRSGCQESVEENFARQARGDFRRRHVERADNNKIPEISNS